MWLALTVLMMISGFLLALWPTLDTHGRTSTLVVMGCSFWLGEIGNLSLWGMVLLAFGGFLAGFCARKLGAK